MKTPFVIEKGLEEKVNIELALLAGTIDTVHPDISEDEEQEYCISLEGLNFAIFVLLVVRNNIKKS